MLTLGLLFNMVGAVLASPKGSLDRADAPTVLLNNATVIGNTNGSVTSFKGIPYAQPP